MSVASVNGTKIAYDDTGGSGPAIVLAHGFLMDRSMFDPQVAALRDAYRVITWDERGFGEQVRLTRAVGARNRALVERLDLGTDEVDASSRH